MRPLFAVAAIASAALSLISCAELPGKPVGNDAPAYAEIIAAANREGKVVVYSVTSAVPLLLEDFQKLYPGVKLEYHALDTTPLFDRIVSESATGNTADVTWSSAMDLQIKLVNDGYAQAYTSPEAANLPRWAIWRNEAYGTTSEPVGFVYNKRLLLQPDVPQDRAGLIRLLNTQPAKFNSKVVAFDPEKSGLGYLLMTQDRSVSRSGFRELVGALGEAKVRPGSGSGAMFTLLGSGECLIGYNLLASYASGRAKKDLPDLGLVLPKDYTLVISRIMFITRKAAHPNAARLWLDYVLSKRGQEIIAKSDLGSIRADVEGEMTLSDLGKRLGNALRPIPVSPELLKFLEAEKRAEFIGEWKTAIGAR